MFIVLSFSKILSVFSLNEVTGIPYDRISSYESYHLTMLKRTKKSKVLAINKPFINRTRSRCYVSS